MKKWLLALTLLSSVESLHAFRTIPDNEQVRNLIQGKEVKSLLEIEYLNLNQGKTSIDLWSGSYWPHYQGSLAVRYRDPQFINLIQTLEQWDKFFESYKKKSAYSYVINHNIDQLSPSEKYDLLVGDSNEMNLTKYSWKLGDKAQLMGSVPTWRGICDGWSSASQMMPRPKKKILLQSPQGLPLTFYPEDIKALGSLLYSRTQKNVIFLGKRCFSNIIGVFNSSCDEINPASFHSALINRVGRMKKSFIADVSPGTEVWNYPVNSYDISYFNVFTDEESKDFREAIEVFVKKNRFNKFHRRHKNTAFIVGVRATVRFTDMRPANLFETDGSSMDKFLDKEYFYDLELDSNYNILGGETASANLPDFIWAPNDGTYPLSDPEAMKRPQNPAELSEMAKRASKNGQPLSVIVEKLFELAK
jgi:hypothetical protein